MSTLTQRQQAIYEFIVQRVRHEGIPPTLMEIADAFGLSSPAGISDHLKAIERKGFIRRRPGTSRGIELAARRNGSPARRRSTRVPVTGTLPSSSRTQSMVDSIVVDGSTATSAAFALRAARSVPRHGILEGDYLIIDASTTPQATELALGRQGRRNLLLQLNGAGSAVRAILGTLRAGLDIEIVGRVTAVVRVLGGGRG